MNELALFAGAGGGILGGKLLGWRTVCAVECDAYAASVLVARQNERILEPFPVWDDVRTFDGRPWRGIVDVVSGGFPCQDISVAGKGEGIEGNRSGLWREFARILGEVRSRYAFVENVPALIVRGLDRVLGDLTELGYDARWGIVGADDVGAPHRRKRMWIVAEFNGECAGRQEAGREARQGSGERDAGQLADADIKRTSQPRFGSSNPRWAPDRVIGIGEAVVDAERLRRGESSEPFDSERESFCAQEREAESAGTGWWESEPDVGRVADGMASWVDRLRALGNGQVPICAAMAFKILSGGT